MTFGNFPFLTFSELKKLYPSVVGKTFFPLAKKKGWATLKKHNKQKKINQKYVINCSQEK